MRFERLAVRIDYCFKFGEDCLDEKSYKFIQDMKKFSDKRGDLFYMSPKQQIFMECCFRKVMLAHPVENETTLERMKRRLAELRSRTKVCARNKRKRDEIEGKGTPGVSPHRFLKQFEETEVTVRNRPHGNRAQRHAARLDVRTAIIQSGKKKRASL